MAIKNEPAGETFVSAYSGPSVDVPHHPQVIPELKSADTDLHKKNITHVIDGKEQAPEDSQPIVTRVDNERVVVKDINGMTGEKGRYYKIKKEGSE